MPKGVRIEVDVDVPRTCSVCGGGLPHHCARVEVFAASNLHPALALCPECAAGVAAQIAFAAGRAAERQKRCIAEAQLSHFPIPEVTRT